MNTYFLVVLQLAYLTVAIICSIWFFVVLNRLGVVFSSKSPDFVMLTFAIVFTAVFWPLAWPVMWLCFSGKKREEREIEARYGSDD